MIGYDVAGRRVESIGPTVSAYTAPFTIMLAHPSRPTRHSTRAWVCSVPPAISGRKSTFIDREAKYSCDAATSHAPKAKSKRASSKRLDFRKAHCSSLGGSSVSDWIAPEPESRLQQDAQIVPLHSSNLSSTYFRSSVRLQRSSKRGLHYAKREPKWARQDGRSGRLTSKLGRANWGLPYGEPMPSDCLQFPATYKLPNRAWP